MTDQERLGPPPIEPLSDVSWARLERGLWSRMDNAQTTVTPIVRRRPWIWLAMPALAAAAVAAILFTRTSGAPEGEPDAQDAQPMRVVSGAAPSAVMFGDAHVTLDAESAVVMSRERDTQSALLEHGAAWFSIAPRGERPPFVVLAGDTVVRVVGTRFRVARSDERATVEVDHGIVDVLYRGSTVKLGAGQRWSSERPSQVFAVETASLEPAKPAVPAPASEPAPVDDPKPTTTHHTDVRRTDTRPADLRHVQPLDTKDLHTQATADANSLDPKQVESARMQYDRMQALEVRDPAAALAGYLALSRGNTRWSEVALFAAGRLAADRHDPRAEGLLKIYLQRFPGQSNAADARKLLAQLKGDH
jgi:hypothetical protein